MISVISKVIGIVSVALRIAFNTDSSYQLAVISDGIDFISSGGTVIDYFSFKSSNFITT